MPLSRILAVFLVALLGWATPTAQAASTLAGKYTIKAVTVTKNNGESGQGSNFAKTAFKIGANGLKGLPGATLGKMIKASGSTNTIKVTVKASSATKLSAALSGTLKSGTLPITSGTLTATLKSSGLTLSAHIKAGSGKSAGMESFVILLTK